MNTKKQKQLRHLRARYSAAEISKEIAYEMMQKPDTFITGLSKVYQAQELMEMIQERLNEIENEEQTTNNYGNLRNNGGGLSA